MMQLLIIIILKSNYSLWIMGQELKREFSILSTCLLIHTNILMWEGGSFKRGRGGRIEVWNGLGEAQIGGVRG